MSDYLDNLYSELSSLVASLGFNDGANKGFWRKQPRKKWGRGKGQWLFMGAKVRLLAKNKGKRVSVTGRVIGSDGTATGARFLPDPGQEALGFDSNTIYGVDTSHIEEISAILPESYVEGKGVDMPDEVGGTGSTVSDANIPNVEDLETAPATPDDFRLADEGVNSPEGIEQEKFKDTPEGQEIARLVDESPDVATPEEVSDLLDGQSAPGGDSIPMLSREEFGKLAQDEINRYADATGGTPEPIDPGMIDEQYGYYKNGYARDEELFGNVDQAGHDSLLPDFTDPILNEAFPDIQKRREADVAARRAVEKAMRGEDPGSLDGLIMAAKEEPKKKKKRASKKKDEEEPIDDGLDDFNPEDDILDTPEFNEPSNGAYDVDFDPSELDGNRISSEVVPADLIEEGDIILHSGEPAKVMRASLERDEDGIETGNLEFIVRTSDGNDYAITRNEYADVTRIQLEKSDEVPDSITPEDVTPESKDVSPVNRIAPDTAEEMSARNDLEVGDKVYSEDGTEFLGTITNVVKSGGRKYTVIDRGDGSKPTQGPDFGTVLVDRPESAPEAETPETNVPDAIDEPVPAPNEIETPEPEDAPAPPPPPGGGGDGNGPTPPDDGDLPTPDEENVPGNTPEEVETPGTPDETRKGRTDNGQEIAFPEGKTEEVLRQKKISPLRDEEGRRVKGIDPDTGEERSTFAEDPDAILNAILEEYPDAVIDEHGAIIVARQKFTDPDGSEYTMESRVTRTNGANYMVSYKITMPDGQVVEYFSNDYRDSFSSIHGVTNGIKRMADVLSGNIPDNFLPKGRGSREWKTYFGTGKFADRLKFFRSKYNSKITQGDLEDALAKATKSGNLYDIGRAQYHLDLLATEFGGDIDKFREYMTTQNMKFLTIDETIQRYASGRFYTVNKSRGKSFGTVMRSAVNGIFGSLRDRSMEDAAKVIREMLGRLPDTTKDRRVVQQIMQQLEEGMKRRFPDENRNTLRRIVRDGVKILEENGDDSGAFESAVHVSWDGRVVTPGMLVEYTNNNNETSVGVIDSLVPMSKNPKRPNEYNDYVLVRFRDQAGELSDPAELSAKTLHVLDETGMTPEALKRLTVYTPNVGGEELRRIRFGDTFMIQERARESSNTRFGVLSEVGDGVNVPAVEDPAYHSTDNAAPGKYLYDANGLPLGQIAAVRDTKSDSGEDGYNIAYVTPENKLEFIAVKAGEIRAPKEGLTRTDGRGTNESDPGFTPDPAAFSDIGLDASTLGSESVDAEAALIDLVKSAPMVGEDGSARAIGRILAVKNARKAYQEDPSDANKKAYKEALSKYYEDLSRMSAVSSLYYNRDFTPMSLTSDDILSPEEIADINGKIRATQMEASKRRPGAPETAPLSYDELKAAASAPEHTYSGFLPAGWSTPDVGAALDFEKAKHADTVKKIIAALGGEDVENISDDLAQALAEGIIRASNTQLRTGEFTPPIRHKMTNEFGDIISVNVNGIPGSSNGYIAGDAEIQKAADVFSSLREKLNIGDKPLDIALTRESGTGALGFVYTADMWSDNAYQARAHLLVDTLPRNIENIKKKSGEKFEPGVSWWSVDLSKDPEGMLAEYVISHEMGHVMQGEALRQFGKNLSQATWNEFYGPVAQSHRVSEYGTTNYNEHFAESFVKWIMTGKAHPDFLKFLKDTGLLKSK